MDIKTITQLECLRCSHKWWPRIETAPKTCPRCKSKDWAIPKMREYIKQLEEKLELAQKEV